MAAKKDGLGTMWKFFFCIPDVVFVQRLVMKAKTNWWSIHVHVIKYEKGVCIWTLKWFYFADFFGQYIFGVCIQTTHIWHPAWRDMINIFCVRFCSKNVHNAQNCIEAQKGFPLWDDRPQKLRRKTLINVYHGLWTINWTWNQQMSS